MSKDEKKKKYKIINGKKVEDHSGLGLKKAWNWGKNLLKINKKNDGSSNKYNWRSDHNKKIREKEKTIKSDTASRKEKATAKSQKAAIIRKRDGKTIKDVQAAAKERVRKAAENRHKKFKETGKSTIEERRAAAKERVRKAAEKRHEAFKAKRKLKIKEKKKKKENKDKYAGISTI